MKKSLLILMIVFGVLLTSCKVKVANNVNPNVFKDGVEYFQCSKTGEVFAVIVVKKRGSADQEGIGLSHIPKSELTDKITSRIKNYNPDL